MSPRRSPNAVATRTPCGYLKSLQSGRLIAWAQTVRMCRPSTCPRPQRGVKCHSSMTRTSVSAVPKPSKAGPTTAAQRTNLGHRGAKRPAQVHGAHTLTQRFFRLKFHGNKATTTERWSWSSSYDDRREGQVRAAPPPVWCEIPVIIPLNLEHQVPPSHSKHAAPVAELTNGDRSFKKRWRQRAHKTHLGSTSSHGHDPRPCSPDNPWHAGCALGGGG